MALNKREESLVIPESVRDCFSINNSMKSEKKKKNLFLFSKCKISKARPVMRVTGKA